MRSSSASGASLTRSATEWVASLDPWPAGGFGLERMHALLGALGDPQERYPAVHVVGTNGKSTTARLTEALLADAGLAVGTYLSPHVRGWSERIRIRGAEADFERALARVRSHAVELEATQFESLTAAALLAFADAGVDVAVVEAGLGGRHDATNVLRTRVVVLTNVALDHMDVLGETRDAIAAEKLAVVQPGSVVVLGDSEWQEQALANGAAGVVVAGASNLALAAAAAEAYLGRRARACGRRGVSGASGRSTRGRRRRAARTPRAPQRASARDLGRGPQPRGRRLPPAAPARSRIRARLLDPARQAAGADAGGTVRPGRHTDRHRVGERPFSPGRGTRSARRTVFQACRATSRSTGGPRQSARARGRRGRRCRHGLPLSSCRAQWPRLQQLA